MKRFETMADFVERQVTLISQSMESVTVPASVIVISETVKSMMLDNESGAEEDDGQIPLPNVTLPVITKIVEFCVEYKKDAMTALDRPLQNADISKLVQAFYFNFISAMDMDSLVELILAANYMKIPPLEDLCSARIASMIKDKTPEQIRANLNIVADFTPEEEALVREENKWVDELKHS